MYVYVKLLKGFSETLLYKIPDNWKDKKLKGAFLKVPIKNTFSTAVVLEQFVDLPKNIKFNIKEACSIEEFPQDINYFNYIIKLSEYYQVDSLKIIKRLRNFINLKECKIPLKEEVSNKNTVILTDEQKKVVSFIKPFIKQPEYKPVLLHGVTGSGKTEVYKELIKNTIDQGKSIVFLLPEVSLAVRFYDLLTKQLPDNIKIFSFHSSSSAKEKKLLWQSLLKGENVLILGVHLPVLLPISNLGLIIVDEEHEVGYQEKRHPKINTKEAAILRANINKIPILLGSATPSFFSLYNVKNKGWKLFQLKKRFMGEFPKIEIVYLNDKKLRRSFWITQKLENEIRDRLRKKEQVIIFLNRRGMSFFVQCKNCSFIFECERCSVSLTLHENNKLHCHYCDFTQDLKENCPKCQSNEFIKKGVGTQRIVTVLEKLFPYAKIDRADLDTTVNKKNWKKILFDFEAGKIDILVGTQTITKGYHFPKVTLVGVLWADLNLHFPIYNASETTLQQIIQVAGRAGRQSNDSKVIIQTMSEHNIFNFVNEIDYIKFYSSEMENRFFIKYPPFIRLAEIELKNTKEDVLEKESLFLVKAFLDITEKENFKIKILGPAKPPISKIKNIFSYKIYLKGQNINEMFLLFKKINLVKLSSKVFFTPNPLN